MPTAFCSFCGNALPPIVDISSVCPTCGAKLSTQKNPEAIPMARTVPDECTPIPVPNVTIWRGRVDLERVARFQRYLIWGIFGACLVILTAVLGVRHVLAGATPVNSVVVGAVFQVILIGLTAGLIVLVVLLLRATGAHLGTIIFYSLLMILPVVNLFLLRLVNGRATAVLRVAGIRVGLTGANREDVRRITCTWLCRSCGYDLTGNTSGVCPECGTATGRGGFGVGPNRS